MLRWLLSIGIFGGMIALCVVGWNIGGIGGFIGGALGALWGLIGRGYDAGERLGNVYTGALVGMPIGLMLGGAYQVGLPYLMSLYS
jgi:hypothetical protein